MKSADDGREFHCQIIRRVTGSWFAAALKATMDGQARMAGHRPPSPTARTVERPGSHHRRLTVDDLSRKEAVASHKMRIRHMKALAARGMLPVYKCFGGGEHSPLEKWKTARGLRRDLRLGFGYPPHGPQGRCMRFALVKWPQSQSTYDGGKQETGEGVLSEHFACTLHVMLMILRK